MGKDFSFLEMNNDVATEYIRTHWQKADQEDNNVVNQVKPPHVLPASDRGTSLSPRCSTFDSTPC